MSQPLELPRWMDLVLLPAFNLALALLVAGAVVAAVGMDPLQVVGWLVKGAFGSRSAVSYTLYYATTFVFTGVRSYRWIMSWLSRPTQPLVMPDPIDSGSLLA